MDWSDVLSRGATAERREESQVSPETLVLSDFKARIDKYVNVQKAAAKDSPRLKESDDLAKIKAAQHALAAKIRAARPNAKQGEIFTPDIQRTLRRLLAPELKGEKGRDTKAILKDEAPTPAEIPFEVNATYPPEQPLPTMPVNLLANLPTLPEQLEYRIIGRHLILRDVQANIIVDFILNAI